MDTNEQRKEDVPAAEDARPAVRVRPFYVGCTGAGLRIFARQRVYARAGMGPPGQSAPPLPGFPFSRPPRVLPSSSASLETF